MGDDMFKVGDKVEDVVRGKGSMLSIDGSDTEYPLLVEYENQSDVETFTAEGFYSVEDEHPTLFHADGYKPPVGGKEPVRYEFEKGEMVLVRNSLSYPWRLSFFSHMNKKTSKYNYVAAGHREGDERFQCPWKHCVKFDLAKVGTI